MRRTGKHTDSDNALTTSTTYRARFRDNPIFFPSIIGLGALCLRLSFLPTEDSPSLVFIVRAFGVLLIILPWIVRARFFVTIDPLGLTACGFFSTHRVEWSDLHEVIALGGHGIRGRGFYGPDVYKLQGTRDAVVLNLKFFSREVSAALFHQVKRLGVTVTYPKDI